MHRLRLLVLTSLLYSPLGFAFSCSLANQAADAQKPADKPSCPRPLDTVQDCGTCNTPCAPANATGPSCKMGTCDYAECKPSRLDCDGNRANGCEIDGASDAAHCGACGKGCGAAQTCQNATCCAQGGLICKGACVDPLTDAQNCGKCDLSCPTAANADPSCANGMCAIVCKTSFADCTGGAQDGCETNTSISKDHCGACGKACPVVSNSTIDCKQAGCTVAACAMGFDNCDMKVDNGCEADLGKPATCGSCNKACKMGENCYQGNCLTGGVLAFGEFRPALKCKDFMMNGISYQRYCFTLKNQTLCTGQHANGKADCIDTPTGLAFVYDYPSTWPMRFTPNTQDCMNYNPAFINNFALAIGYAKYTIKQTKTGNSCTRSWIDDSGKFQTAPGNSGEAQIYEIEYFN